MPKPHCNRLIYLLTCGIRHKGLLNKVSSSGVFYGDYSCYLSQLREQLGILEEGIFVWSTTKQVPIIIIRLLVFST